MCCAAAIAAQRGSGTGGHRLFAHGRLAVDALEAAVEQLARLVARVRGIKDDRAELDAVARGVATRQRPAASV
jgi:hypothetical protein